jgi:hypothetical protein
MEGMTTGRFDGEERIMADHIRIAAVLRIVYSVIGLVGAGLFFLFVGTISLALGPVGALLSAFLVFVLAVMGLSALPGLLAGWGMLHYHPWARILNVVLCFFDLFTFPVGTALAAYSLWVLFHPESIRLFEQGTPSAANRY